MHAKLMTRQPALLHTLNLDTLTFVRIWLLTFIFATRLHICESQHVKPTVVAPCRLHAVDWTLLGSYTSIRRYWHRIGSLSHHVAGRDGRDILGEKETWRQGSREFPLVVWKSTIATLPPHSSTASNLTRTTHPLLNGAGLWRMSTNAFCHAQAILGDELSLPA